MFSAESKAVYVRTKPARLTNAATGESIAGDAPADLDNVRINNRLRGAIDAALGGLTLLAGDPGTRSGGGAGRVQVAGGERAADARDRARRRNRIRGSSARWPRPGPRSSWLATRAATMKTCRRGHRSPARRPGRTRAPFQPSADTSPAVMKAANDDDRGDQEPACAVGSGAGRLVWDLFGLGPAARRHRPRHHLRRHGRDQHGAWRDGDARRLCHLRRAGRDPRAQSGIVRLFAR